MIKVKLEGLDVVAARLAGMGKQVNYAAARALTKTAHDANADVKQDLKTHIQGGPTAFTLRAFKVEAATKATLTATIGLRTDTPAGGNSYESALQHIFTGGSRHWKKLEGWLRGRGLLPAGMMIAPGPKAPLDARGNFRRAALREMTGILASNIRNLRVHRRAGRQTHQKSIGFFVALPGDRSGLTPGIWRRIETEDAARGSIVEPWIMYIQPTRYQQKFSLEKIVKTTVDRKFQQNFQQAFADAMRTTR